ncbi:MAG: hypothetical protein M1816_004258 [Peltula sp. TS41687]|nr:MAG: hypothetical protein M1816_004258 [Peltula sp. TS41687]
MLPDVDVIVRASDDVGRALRKLVNVPALDQGSSLLQLFRDEFSRQNSRIDRIDQTLTSIREDIARQNLQTAQNFQALGQKIDGLDKKLDASNVNNVARAQNSMLMADDDLLTALVNGSTKELIQSFPERPASIDRMTGPQLRAVLGELGIRSSRSMTVDGLKQSLRVQIGLRPRRVVGA